MNRIHFSYGCDFNIVNHLNEELTGSQTSCCQPFRWWCSLSFLAFLSWWSSVKKLMCTKLIPDLSAKTSGPFTTRPSASFLTLFSPSTSSSYDSPQILTGKIHCSLNIPLSSPPSMTAPMAMSTHTCSPPPQSLYSCPSHLESPC